MERRLNQLNGYHDGIMEAFKNATSQRDLSGTASIDANLLDDDTVRKSLAKCGYPDAYKIEIETDQDNIDNQDDDEEDDMTPPIRIRNLEDLIRQLEHHSARHMSPSGSEEIRMSENDDRERHYRIDSSVCSESSQG